MRVFTLILTAILFSLTSRGQLVITNEPSATALAQKLVGNGITISNVSFTGNSLMAGHFKNLGQTDINIDSGIVLTTGRAKSANFNYGLNGDGTSPSNFLLASTSWFLPGDATLANAIDAPLADMNDACILEFDFIPLGDTVKFNYVFSSEEYEPIFACSEFIDAFGFFISGPGITGRKNIALVPGTNLPVSILNINDVFDFGSALCPMNPSYYVDNVTNTYFTHEGHTARLTAISAVQPCNVYHLKLVISDNVDDLWDSGVFLEAKSLTSNVVALTNNTQTDLSNNSYTVEGCNSGSFTIKRAIVSALPLSVQLTYGGTAINGVDVLTLPPTVTIPANDSIITITVLPIADGIPEGVEYLKIFAGFGCSSAVPIDSTVIQIRDYDTSTTNINICPNELPYVWNGNNYSAFGTYSVTLVNSVGCDSIATLNLSGSGGGTSITNISICSSQLPYSWNANSYSAPGTYSVTLGSTGCDSVATLNLTVNSIVTSTTNITVCNNQLPYTWNGNSYPASGNYPVTLISNSGCDSIATLNLSVNNVVTSTTDIVICNNQLPYTWNGNSYPAAGIYPVTLISNSGCDSIATLNLSVNNIVTSTTDIIICNNQLPYTWNGNSYSSAGNYPVTLTSSSGCDSIATLNLSVNNIVTSTTDIVICNNQLPYTWNGNSYPAAGNYSVTLTSSSGCDSIATLNLSVNNIVTSTTDIGICNNQLPYSWNGNSYPAAGNYPVTLISNSGCDSIATLNLSVNNIVTSTTNIGICNNQLPYSWNGNSYPAAGNYPVTLTSNSGCDSIATLNLSVNNIVISTTDIVICNTQLPYTWNGNIYPAAGNYSVTLTSSSGCDSIATLNLSVNNVVTSITDIVICNNQLPYSWNGNSYSTAGIYLVTLISNSGCDSIATLNLSVNNVVTSTTDIGICNNQLPYTWNGNSYPAAGNYSVTLTSSSGCDSIATLNLSVNNVVTSTTDIIICNNQLPYSWNGNSYPAAGNYPVTLISNSGCDSIATLNLSVNNIVTSTTDIGICNNQLPYTWNGNTYPSAGNYSVTLTSSSGCDSIATLNLSVNNVVTSTTDITICNNQLPYSWNGNSYSAAGIYPVTLTSNSGCDSIATLDLSVNNVVTSTTDIGICNNQLPYTWNGNTYPSAGIYPVTLTSNSGCDSIATLNLSVNNIVTSTTDIAICNNQLPYSWNGSSYPAAGNYSVTLTSSSGCDSIATLNLSVNNVVTSTTDITICNNQLPYTWNGNSYPAAGNYPVTLISNSGCDSIATLNLSVNNIVTSTTDIVICNNQLPYTWNGNSYSAAGIYPVTLTSSSGCDSIATLNLSVNNIVTSSTDIIICNNQLPYSWNGNSYPAAGNYPVTLTGNSGCDSIATLNLSVNNIVTSTTAITICNNQLPYTWNGSSYPSAGNYSVTLTSSSGCDSIATLDLTVNSFVTSITNVTICSNQFPYVWNGNIYNTPGNYVTTLISASGCDSIATLNLISNAVVNSTTNVTICNAQLPYTWNGNTYSSAGIYLVTLVSSSGCDSLATLNLVSNASVTSITNLTICNSQLPYSWNGNSYSTGGNYSVTLTSSSDCDSIATLNLSVNPGTTSTTGVAVCPNQLPYAWNGNNYSAAGTYSVTLTGSNGCDSVAKLVLSLTNIPTSTTVMLVCDNLLPYQWNGQSFMTPGLHIITLTTSTGCDSIARLNLIINPVVYSTTPVSICSASLPYSWNGQNYSTGGLHIVTLSSSAGCDSVATLNLTVNPTPSVPSVASPVIYCQHDNSFALNAAATTPGSQLKWYLSPAGGIGSATPPMPSTAIAGSKNYYVSQVNGPCEGARALITVTVNGKPDLGQDRTLRVCFGESADIGALYNTAGTTANWIFNQQPVDDPSAVNVAGIYRLEVKNATGCSDTSFVNLGIQPPVIANAGPDNNAEYNAPYYLSGSGGLQYQWSPPTLVNNPFIANPVATLKQDAILILLVKDAEGCMDLDTVKLRVLKGPALYIPTAFSPNADGLNDVFRPTAVGIAGLEFFRVFNRYGEIIFETQIISKGWDGTYKGKAQNTGNYVWIIKSKDRLGNVKTTTGNVTLLR